ncbi:MAG: hypothetical protein K1X88_14170 [Nannocystaceae bacterium]|nr:hypothetical protein [Nannocystaceae bacterium]
MRAEHDAPYWCEENAWHLCADARLASHRVDVIVVSNPARQVALFHQRAAPHPAAPVVWDYHVLLGSRDDQGRTWIWDLDTRLEFPADARAWLHATVRALPGVPAARFRAVPASQYRAHFGSDRSHMRGRDGAWLQPPPPWPPIGASHRLDALLAFDDDAFGPWLDDADALQRWLARDDDTG